LQRLLRVQERCGLVPLFTVRSTPVLGAQNLKVSTGVPDWRKPRVCMDLGCLPMRPRLRPLLL
jgi:hypothetical protein